MEFEEQFGEIARRLGDLGNSAVKDAARFEVAHGLISDAMLLIRDTAPPGLAAHHAWLGAVQIVNQFAHEIAHAGLESD